ncbi:MAG: Saccharopine dehydrogenase [Caulobacter sp.]|nr:Saccharopine dehydrogenase [Caulobacter sp.]
MSELPTARRIVVVGASGVFGARLSAMIARWPDAVLVLAARRTGPLEALKAVLAKTASARIETAAFDRDAPDMSERLAALTPWAVADAAGPFQGAGYDLARAALSAGAHYVDIADGRDFVGGFADALDAEARAAGKIAATGASSTPAITHAALERMTEGWTRIDTVSAAISPGSRAPRGVSVIRAALTWVGKPIRVFDQGAWTQAPGWGLTRRLIYPGLGRRWASLAETPDLDLMPAHLHPNRSAVMRAGMELSILHLGLWLLSWPVRWRWLKSLTPFAELLRQGAGLTAPFGSDRGGMVVEADGLGPEGERRWARWSLAAEPGAGPSTPAAPAAALLRALLDSAPPAPGAGACVGLVSLDAITAQLSALPIVTRLEAARPDAPGLFPRLMADFDALPDPVRWTHSGQATVSEGRAVARGSGGPAALVRLILGLPGKGRHTARVEITPQKDGAERWTRRFGTSRFQSRLTPVAGDPGAFDETAGPISFRFRPVPRPYGFDWLLDGWRLGPVPLPRAWGPKVRGRSFSRDGVYRFSVLVAHPLAGLVFAYAGRLSPAEMTTP